MSGKSWFENQNLSGSEDNSSNYYTKSIFDNLVNEIPNSEIESKLKPKGEIQPRMLLEKLSSYFTSQSLHFDLYISHIFSASSLIDKFAYQGGHFSVVSFSDEMMTIKRKTQKQIVLDNVLLCYEERVSAGKEDNALKLAVQAFHLPTHEITYIGRVRREKESLALVSSLTGRVYTLVIDITQIEEPGEQHSSVTEPLRQIELEYKGRDLSSQTPSENRETGSLPVKVISLEIAMLRKEVKKQLRLMNIFVTPTQQTKTNWLKKHGKAFSTFEIDFLS